MSQQACGETEAQGLAHNQRDRHGPPASLSSLSVRGKCLHLEPSRGATSRRQHSLSGPCGGCSPGADSRLTPTAQLPAHSQARSGKRRGEPGAAPLQAHGQLLSPQTGAPLSLVTFNWPKGLAGSIPLALGNGSEGRGGRTWGRRTVQGFRRQPLLSSPGLVLLLPARSPILPRLYSFLPFVCLPSICLALSGLLNVFTFISTRNLPQGEPGRH